MDTPTLVPSLVGLIFVLIVFVGAWEFRFLREKKGLNYIDNFFIVGLYFSFWSMTLVFAFQEKFSALVAGFTTIPFIFLLLLFVFNALVYSLLPKFFKRPRNVIKSHPKELFLYLDYRYIFSKSFDILFQQVAIILIILFLRDMGLGLAGIIPIFALIFGFLHLPLVKTKKKFFGYYYTFSAILSAIFLPLIILQIHYGFVWTYIIHWLFYSLSSIIFWIGGERIEGIFRTKMKTNIQIPLP